MFIEQMIFINKVDNDNPFLIFTGNTDYSYSR